MIKHNFAIELSMPYVFDKASCDSQISQNLWVKHHWPMVYILKKKTTGLAYVGESTRLKSRIYSHLLNPDKAAQFNEIHLASSDSFNKSAALDIESNLIKYLSSEGSFQLQNKNYGIANHNYHQKNLYQELFVQLWAQLQSQSIVSKSIAEIENSELFKYSPYKALNDDQHDSVLEIVAHLNQEGSASIITQGTAGTGKTVLATYLIKLLSTKITNNIDDDVGDGESSPERSLVMTYQAKYPDAKIGLVIAMTSLRETLRKVFRHTPGLNPKMVLSPSDVAMMPDQYDLLVVDEAHRLRQRKNISWMGVFDRNNRHLKLDKHEGTELDWILNKSNQQLFFYDSAQSVKPSDINPVAFDRILSNKHTKVLTLKSQMRALGGNDYIDFVQNLLHVTLPPKARFLHPDYECCLFMSIDALYARLAKKEQQYGLCRLLAGYAWPWVSKKDPRIKDITIGQTSFSWNSTSADWINAPNAFSEVGCIHTTQGYDLNYAGIIFGREIDYDEERHQIVIDRDLYFDLNGKKGIESDQALHDYIINIYKTLMYRAVRGTYVYAYHDSLRAYLSRHMVSC